VNLCRYSTLRTLIAALLTSLSAHAAAIKPDGEHVIEIGLDRGGTAQANVLSNGGIYEIKVRLSEEAAAKYAIVPSTLSWTCTDGTFAGETDGKTTVTWLSPDRGGKTEEISVSGKLRPLGTGAGPGSLLDFAGQVEAKIYEPIILLASEAEYKPEGQARSFTISGDIWAKYGEEQESIAATLTVHWAIVGAQEVSADKAHFDNNQISKTVQTTDQWVSTEMALTDVSRRGEVYMVAARVAVSEAKTQTAVASLSESVTVVGVEIEGADELLEIGIGQCVTLTAITAPAGGILDWKFNHTEDYYTIEETGIPNTIRIRLNRQVDDLLVDAEYTQGTASALALRPSATGALLSDAAAVKAEVRFTCFVTSELIVCGIDEIVSVTIEADTSDPEVILQGIDVAVGNWIATTDPAQIEGTLLPFAYQLTAPAEDIDAGLHEITVTPKCTTVTVDPPPYASPPQVAVIHVQIDGHDAAEWHGVGDHDTVELKANVVAQLDQGLDGGQYEWILPNDGVVVVSGAASGPDATDTIQIRFTKGTPFCAVDLAYTWPAPLQEDENGEPIYDPYSVPIYAMRDDGVAWIGDLASFKVIQLGEITGTLDEILYGEQKTLAVEAIPALSETGGNISWAIEGASGTFNPAGPSATTQTTFTLGNDGTTATITATYTKENAYTCSHRQFTIAGRCRIATEPAYALVGANMDVQGQSTEIKAEGAPAGGTFTWNVTQGSGTIECKPENRDTAWFTGGTAGQATVEVEYDTGGGITDTAEAELKVYDLKVDWTQAPTHNWVSVGDSVELTSKVYGQHPDGDEDFGALSLHWEASAAGQDTLTHDGTKFTLPFSEWAWSVTAYLRIQRQGTTDEPEELGVSETKSLRGVRLHIEGYDQPTSIAMGAQRTLTATVENAPGPQDGTFKWTCDKAEFWDGSAWVKDTDTAAPTTATVTLRFTEPSPQTIVNVTYTPSVPEPPTLQALRWDASTEHYVSDQAAFSVCGFKIVTVPAYAITGERIDIDGNPVRIEAIAHPATPPMGCTWSVSPSTGGTVQEGTAQFYSETSIARFPGIFCGGTEAGTVTVSATATEDVDGNGTADESTVQFPVYDLRLDLQRKPTHDWVAVGDWVALTAMVYGDPGAKDLNVSGENIYWEIDHQNGEILEATNATTLDIPVGFDLLRARAMWYPTDQETGEHPADPPVETVALPHGVWLNVKDHNIKEMVLVGQEITLETQLMYAPTEDTVKYRWTCAQAEFKNGDAWVGGDYTTTATAVTARFKEAGDDLALKVAARPYDASGNPLTDVNDSPVTIPARRPEDGNWVSDDAIFVVVGIKRLFIRDKNNPANKYPRVGELSRPREKRLGLYVAGWCNQMAKADLEVVCNTEPTTARRYLCWNVNFNANGRTASPTSGTLDSGDATTEISVTAIRFEPCPTTDFTFDFWFDWNLNGTRDDGEDIPAQPRSSDILSSIPVFYITAGQAVYSRTAAKGLAASAVFMPTARFCWSLFVADLPGRQPDGSESLDLDGFKVDMPGLGMNNTSEDQASIPLYVLPASSASAQNVLNAPGFIVGGIVETVRDVPSRSDVIAHFADPANATDQEEDFDVAIEPEELSLSDTYDLGVSIRGCYVHYLRPMIVTVARDGEGLKIAQVRLPQAKITDRFDWDLKAQHFAAPAQIAYAPSCGRPEGKIFRIEIMLPPRTYTAAELAANGL